MASLVFLCNIWPKILPTPYYREWSYLLETIIVFTPARLPRSGYGIPGLCSKVTDLKRDKLIAGELGSFLKAFGMETVGLSSAGF